MAFAAGHRDAVSTVPVIGPDGHFRARASVPLSVHADQLRTCRGMRITGEPTWSNQQIPSATQSNSIE